MFDSSLRYGDGIFDMLRTYGGKLPPFADKHVHRFATSCERMHIAVPRERKILDVLEGMVIHDEESRFLLTGTRGLLPHYRSGEDSESHFSVSQYPLKWIIGPQAHVYDGVEARQVMWEQPFAEMKHQSRIGFRMAEQATGGKWTICTDRWGKILECTGANVFWYDAAYKRIVTPGGRCLPGITAQVVCELARLGGYEVARTDVTLAEISTTPGSEVFFTCSPLGIVPCSLIDSWLFSDKPVTRNLAGLFMKHVGLDYEAQARKWAKPIRDPFHIHSVLKHEAQNG